MRSGVLSGAIRGRYELRALDPWRLSQLEALRQYLKAMPAFADLLLVALGGVISNEEVDHNKMEDMREAFRRAQADAFASVTERKVPYFIVTFPQVVYKCPACNNDEIKGGYYEISNPLTNARAQFRVRMMHDFLVHGETGYKEPIINMSDTVLGEDDHVLDVPKMAKVLAGLPLPPDVEQELRTPVAAV
jgi:hypothetical protein